MSFSVEKIRQDFPALHQLVYDKPLVYLDNAATSFKPQIFIDAIIRYYGKETANVHRGIHYLSERATRRYEEARKKLSNFIGAATEDEIIFTKGTTESINFGGQLSPVFTKKRRADFILHYGASL